MLSSVFSPAWSIGCTAKYSRMLLPPSARACPFFCASRRALIEVRQCSRPAGQLPAASGQMARSSTCTDRGCHHVGPRLVGLSLVESLPHGLVDVSVLT